MNDIQFGVVEKKVYPVLPKDVYQCEFLGINKIETKPKYNNPDEMETVMTLQFVIVEDGNRLRCLWDNFVPTQFWTSQKFGKNKLWKIVEALTGKEYTKETLNGFQKKDLEALIGKQLRLSVDQKPGTKNPEQMFNKIVDYLPAKGNYNPLTNEEKEQCRVKPKSNINQPTEKDAEKPINPDEIPF